MFGWLGSWWYAMNRRIDLEIFWPSCKKIAPDLNGAKAAFAMHAFNDPAWLALPHDEITRIIDALE